MITESNNGSELKEVDVIELEEQLLALEKEQQASQKALLDSKSWYLEQLDTVLGGVISHVEQKIIEVGADVKKISVKLDDPLPKDQDRIDMRVKFHSRLLRSLRFNVGWASLLIFLPVFFTFLDNLGFITPLGPAIYPIVAAVFGVISLIVLIILRVKQGKLKWSWKRILLWISLTGFFSGLISIWPIVGIFVKIILKAPFMPNGWQIILAALALFLVRYFNAIRDYHASYKKHFDDLERAHRRIKWYSNAESVLRAKQKFENFREQLFYWHSVLGTAIRKPWITDSQDASSSNIAIESSFPRSIRVAHATDDRDGDNELGRICDKLVVDLSKKGWRKTVFEENFMNLVKRTQSNGVSIAHELSEQNIATAGHLSTELITLLNDETLLSQIGEEKRDELVVLAQTEILNSDIRVSSYNSLKNEFEPVDWTKHLLSIAQDPESTVSTINEPLKNWSFVEEHSHKAPIDEISTFLAGPAEVLKNVPANSGLQKKEVEPNHDNYVQILLRLDLVGLTSRAIAVEEIKIPQFSNHHDAVEGE